MNGCIIRRRTTIPIARAHLVDPSVSRWYHYVTRRVRRKRSLARRGARSDRKVWIESRLHELAEIFAVSVGCPIEDRRWLDSAREGMLEGLSLGNYLLCPIGTLPSYRGPSCPIDARPLSGPIVSGPFDLPPLSGPCRRYLGWSLIRGGGSFSRADGNRST